MPIIRYLEVTIRRAFGKLDKFEKFEPNLVLYLDTIMRFTQNDLFRRLFQIVSQNKPYKQYLIQLEQRERLKTGGFDYYCTIVWMRCAFISSITPAKHAPAREEREFPIMFHHFADFDDRAERKQYWGGIQILWTF